MEPITWGIILAPALQGLTAIALAIQSEVIGGRADAAVCAGYKAFTNHLKRGGKPVNHDLQKAVRRSYLSALQGIASECHDELTQEANHPGGYLLGHRGDIQWLNQKRKQLAAELKEVDKAEYVEASIGSFQEIESLLTPEGQLAENQIQAVKQKLLAEVLKDSSVPSCYKAKLEHATEGLFERMCAYFAFEIKNNQVVSNIFEGQLLVQINQNLAGQKLTIQDLENSLRNIARDLWRVLEKLDNLEAAVREGNYKLDQGFGDVLAVVTPSAASIEEIKALLEQLIKEGIPPSVGLERQQYENIPRSGVVEFVGRSQELETLHQQLQQQDRVAIAAIAGMGGVGKTELAIQYARSHLQTYQGGVCWLQARSLDIIGVQIVKFGRSQLNLNPPEDLDPASQVAFCWRNWPPGEVLVVLDDVTDYKQVKPYLPPESSRFKVLVTTLERMGSPLARIDIDVLSPAAALDLLRSLAGTEQIERELAVAEKLCEWLGYLPLGLELVGRYVEQEPDLSLEKLLSRLQNKKRLRHEALVETDPIMTAQLGVADAFELSWERLDQAAQELGCLLSLFALAPIPWSLVESVATEEDPEDLESARTALVRLHLLQRTGEGTYRLHQLIREFLQEKLAQSAQADDLKRAFAAAMAAVAQQIPESPTRELIIAITPSIPHITEVATSLTDWLSDDYLSWPFIGLGRFYEGQGFYDQAKPWREQCLSATQTRFGTDHPDVATSLNNLAGLYDSQGRYSEAEPLYVQALELYKRLLGEEHPHVATSLNNLANLYWAQGRYSEAEPLYVQALELHKRLLGEEHPHVATSLNNLAGLYDSQGRYSEAGPLYVQALELRQRLLGEEHPRVATSLNNLALLYKSQGRYSEAEPLYVQALELRQRLLGEEHPDVAASLNNLAVLYRAQGCYSEAEPLYVQALELRQRLLGEEHPDVAQSLNNLAWLYDSQGRYSEAEQLYVQALAILEQQLGSNRPITIKVRENLEALRCPRLRAGIKF